MKFYNGQEELKGLLFMKSMMSMNNVKKQAIVESGYAKRAGINCEAVAVDDSASSFVDRQPMRDLVETLESGKYEVLVVEDIYDITREPEDLRVMIDRINDMGILIFDLGIMGLRFNNYEIGC
ncbi:MAG: DNA invertase [Lachnospiraceae bacterium]|nr:DNA invertase [Lachnospiraceae bacterium]